MPHSSQSTLLRYLLATTIVLASALFTAQQATPDQSPPAAVDAEQFVARQKALGKTPNRLLSEKSPYLLKHAFNPVDWHPWSDEAFALAKKLERPIFLSIGYATCHWCNVMEEESFDNPEIAAIMNQWFVNVKVDREERPDVDRMYLAATVELTGTGGWPMTLFLTPEGKPFYAGTYFPPQARYGKPGLTELLEAIHRAWSEDRSTLLIQADKAITNLASQQQRRTGQSTAELSTAPFAKIFEQLSQRFDPEWGGFGTGQKFPRTMALDLLLRLRLNDAKHQTQAREMALLTLRRMADSGINDHLGGGFHRYAVDRNWRTPHFEKMLSDQAQLAMVYLAAYQISNDDLFRHAAEATIDYVLAKMTGPEGGFYSAEDADSEKTESPGTRSEGAFYTWRRDEITRLLSQPTADLFSFHYGVQDNGNAQTDPLGELSGVNILYKAETIASTAKKFSLPEQEARKILQTAKTALLKARDKRPRPYLDDKRTAAQNGLMLSTLARASGILARPEYQQAAERAAGFIEKSLVDRKTGLLSRRFRDEQTGLVAQLADYSFVVQGLLDLYSVNQENRWLDLALRLNEKSYTLFIDQDKGDLFETAADPTVPLRLKAGFEDSEPSGTAMAALNFLRIAKMLSLDLWRERAEKILTAYSDGLKNNPAAMPQMVIAQDFAIAKVKQIVIAGRKGDAATEKMLTYARRRFLPRSILLFADGSDNQQYLAEKLAVFGSMGMINNTATAYVCQNFVCQLPTTDFPTFVRSLEE